MKCVPNSPQNGHWGEHSEGITGQKDHIVGMTPFKQPTNDDDDDDGNDGNNVGTREEKGVKNRRICKQKNTIIPSYHHHHLHHHLHYFTHGRGDMVGDVIEGI